MSRLRTQGALANTVKSEYFRIYGTCPETSYVKIGETPEFAVGSVRTMVDVVTPSFRKRQKAGEVMMNDMFWSELTSVRSGSSFEQYHYATPFSCSGVNRMTTYQTMGNHFENIYATQIGQNTALLLRSPPLPNLMDSSLGSLLSEAETRVLSERGRSDQNLFESLAESDKALGTITGILKTAYKTLRTLNPRGLQTSLSSVDDITKYRLKKELRNSKDFLKHTTSGYLAWRYGIKPMIQDIDTVIEGLQSKVGQVRKTTRSSASGSTYSSRNLVYVGASTVTMKEFMTDTVKVRAMSLDEHLLTRANALGFSAKGLITLPWELVSYSFVLDWFANLGDFIGSCVPAFGWTCLGSCHVVDRVRETNLSVVSDVNNTSGYLIDIPYGGTFKHTLHTRARATGLPHQAIVIKSDFRFDNVTRCLDAFSLLAQRLLK